MHYHAEIAANFQNMMQERENGSFFSRDCSGLAGALSAHSLSEIVLSLFLLRKLFHVVIRKLQ